MDDVQLQFRDELTVLRDNLIAAINSNRASDARRGYDIYERLVDTILSEYAKEPAIQASVEWGTEWRWLSRDIYEICQAALSNNDVAVMAAVDFTTRIAQRSLERGSGGLTASSMDMYCHLWTGTLEQESLRSAQHYLLVSLQNFAMIYVPARKTLSEDQRRVGVLNAIRVFTQMLRACVDAGDIDSAKRLLDHFGPLYEYGETGTSIDTDSWKSAARLAVLAWTLLKRERGLDVADPRQLIELLTSNGLRGGTIWPAYRIALAESSAGTMWWNRWEMELNPPLRASVLTFSTFVSLAAVVIALRKGDLVTPRRPTKDDASMARLMREQIVKGAGTLVGLQIPMASDAEALAERLDQLTGIVESEEQQRLARAHVESDRIEQFRQGLQEAITTAPRLLDRFLATKRPEAQETPESITLGVNILVPKEFFVRTEVIADPKSLGSDLGASLMRAEEAYLVERLVTDDTEQRPVRLAQLRDAVSRWRRDIRGERLLVVSINSWLVGQQLGATHEDRVIRFNGTKAEHFTHYDDTDRASCLVVDLATCGRAMRKPSGWEGLSTLPGTDLDVSVSGTEVTSEAEPQPPQAQVRVAERLTWLPSRSQAVLLLHVADADW